MISPRFLRYGTVDSTNDIAIEMLRRGEPEGTVVTAVSQSTGRGRRGRIWQDRPGESAILSVVLRPNKDAARLHELAFVAAVGLVEHLASDCGIVPSLKWPNDVMIGDKKIAGILVETEKVSGTWGAVVGIGLNVNQLNFSAGLCSCATSIAIETGTCRCVDEACERLASRVLEAYDQYDSDGFDHIVQRWTMHMWGIGKSVRLNTESGLVSGTMECIDRDGALVICDASGKRQSVHVADTIRLS